MLNSSEIAQLVEQQGVITNFDEGQLEASSYDLRIGSIFRAGEVFKREHERVFLQPGEILTCLTLEEVNLPANIAGMLFPRNEESAKGLLVINPGHIDPGFKGALTIKAVNLRRVPFVVAVGQPIFTMCLTKLSGPSQRPYARNARSREERERILNEHDQGYHLRSLTDLVTEEPLNKLADDVLKRKASDAINQQLTSLLWKWGLAYAVLILCVTAYGVDFIAFAKSIFWAVVSEVKDRF